MKALGTQVAYWFACVLVSCVVLGFFDSNVFWGNGDQYGKIDIPGSAVVHLPARSVDASVAALFPGRGNETPNVPIPRDATLQVAPVSGGASVSIERSLGSSENAPGSQQDAMIRVWKVDVPADGDYKVSIDGDFAGLGVNQQLWLGHKGPLSDAAFLIAGVLLGSVVFVGITGFRSRKAHPR
jgi:hypothetical protein